MSAISDFLAKTGTCICSREEFKQSISAFASSGSKSAEFRIGDVVVSLEVGDVASVLIREEGQGVKDAAKKLIRWIKDVAIENGAISPDLEQRSSMPQIPVQKYAIFGQDLPGRKRELSVRFKLAICRAVCASDSPSSSLSVNGFNFNCNVCRDGTVKFSLSTEDSTDELKEKFLKFLDESAKNRKYNALDVLDVITEAKNPDMGTNLLTLKKWERDAVLQGKEMTLKAFVHKNIIDENARDALKKEIEECQKATPCSPYTELANRLCANKMRIMTLPSELAENTAVFGRLPTIMNSLVNNHFFRQKSKAALEFFHSQSIAIHFSLQEYDGTSNTDISTLLRRDWENGADKGYITYSEIRECLRKGYGVTFYNVEY